MSLFKQKSNLIDMTEGSTVKLIFRFMLPLLLGNLFQQLYNMVDTWVIGQTHNAGAYAAVGSIGPITNVLIGIFLGLSTGAGVVISQFFGAKKIDEMRKTLNTSVAMTVVLSIVFTIVGLVATPYILKVMLKTDGSDESVYPFALSYLQIYFAGISGLMIYNMGAAILRAVGDSNRPFIYLCISTATNIGLDFLFVFAFDLGVIGVALATIISQFISAICVCVALFRSKDVVKIRIKEIGFYKGYLQKICKVGIPGALQMSITAFSNIFVMSYIGNVIDIAQEYSLSAWTTYAKMDQLMYLPTQSLALAVTTFVAQNMGIGNEKRAKKGTYVTWVMSLIWVVFAATLIEVFARPCARFFIDDSAVIEASVTLLRWITPFYICTTINQIYTASLRGAGDANAPMFLMLGSFVVFRQIYLFVVSNFISNTQVPIAFSYPAGWICCSIATLIYWFVVGYKKGKKNIEKL